MTMRIGRRAFLKSASLLGAGAALGLMAAARPVLAQSLDEARQQGLVGELPNGYVGVVRSAPGVQALVDSINAQRRQRYMEIAQANNVPLAAVEQQAGQQLIQRLPPGQYYMTPGGNWAQK